MRRFLIKVLLSFIPFFVLTLFSYFFYDYNSGDIKRVGYLFDEFPNYREVFANKVISTKYFNSFNEIDPLIEYDIFTIGDSFSEQGLNGFQNYLAKNSGFDILHLDKKYHSNPAQTLISLTNGDFFEKVKVRYVVLEMVERHFIDNCLNTIQDSVLHLSQIDDRFKDDFQIPEEKLLSNRIFKFPYFSLKRLFRKEEEISKVYEFKTTNKNFSVESNRLYVYRIDINNLNYNNSLEKLKQANEVLSNLSVKLKNKGIELVVFPAPNKFSFYYRDIDFISKFEKPQFFNNFDLLNKPYLFFNILNKSLEGSSTLKDFYYYDDSHWSPISSKLVADQLFELVSN